MATLAQLRNHAHTRRFTVSPTIVSAALLIASLASFAVLAASAQLAPPVVLDRVIVVVNQQTILASDLDRELRLSILDPNLDFAHRPASSDAIQHLISRALIHQQFVDQPLLTPAQLQKTVDARIIELRSQLPACVRLHCVSPEGWQAFLTESNLSDAEVETFFREQTQILDFIEQRFRAGIHITPEQIAAYYQTTLLPQYANPAQAPTLDSVSQRINEILLGKQVNLLLEDWLTTLRKEGDVEFLDSSLDAPATHVETAPTLPEATPAPTSGGPLI
jgi:peptidyl-prolyl cis-trans isomerase SurA